jgi:hypothetical protein
MKGRIIGVTTRGEFTNDQGRTFPASATFYVIRKNKGENSFGEMGDELRLPTTDSMYNDLLLGTQDFRHSIGAVVDYSFTATQYGKKLEDIELVSYINKDGEVIQYNEGADGEPLYLISKKNKASA